MQADASQQKREIGSGAFLTSYASIWLCAAAAFACAACSSDPPYRKLLEAHSSTCEAVYEHATWNDAAGRKDDAAEMARVRKLIKADLNNPQTSACWDTSFEHHTAYDLYSVEFDDQGWLAGTASGHIPDATQMTLLIKGLNDLVQGRGSPKARPLSIVIYTHGWHHSAAPDDGNVIAFRRLLRAASDAERELCLANRSDHPVNIDSADASTCSESESEGESVEVWRKKRRVVGIYVGWRGDSVLGRYIEATSIWDRKLAAEAVALGSVQEFFARMHAFYVEHECHDHSERKKVDLSHCADVRLLTVGHSFGGLITYRALAPRLMFGIVETQSDEFDPRLRYAYGFGDLTVLINPAFEASRFEPLAEAASSRSYFTAEEGASAQLPLLIIATSKTDWATHYTFPAFRWPTTRFERSKGAERGANINTVGWDPRYRTHSLQLMPTADELCHTSSDTPLAERLLAEAQWTKDEAARHFASFEVEKTLDLCDSLRLSREDTWGLKRPPYMPLWVIQADKTVIDGHNDFLNIHFVDFIRQVYYTILREEDQKLKSRVQSGSTTNP